VDLWVLALHVASNAVWVGSLLAVLVVVGMPGEGAKASNLLGLRVYRALAIPGFLGSLVFGGIRLGLDWRYYLVTTHFMHAKLLLVAVAIAAHHVVGAGVRAGGLGRLG
jgi:putative membrane protein